MMNLQTLKIAEENTMDYKLLGEKMQPLGGDVAAVGLGSELLHDVDASCTRPSILQH
jgi:hypothetical protein